MALTTVVVTGAVDVATGGSMAGATDVDGGGARLVESALVVGGGRTMTTGDSGRGSAACSSDVLTVDDVAETSLGALDETGCGSLGGAGGRRSGDDNVEGIAGVCSMAMSAPNNSARDERCPRRGELEADEIVSKVSGQERG
jgi:hypothetical protein